MAVSYDQKKILTYMIAARRSHACWILQWLSLDPVLYIYVCLCGSVWLAGCELEAGEVALHYVLVRTKRRYVRRRPFKQLSEIRVRREKRICGSSEHWQMGAVVLSSFVPYAHGSVDKTPSLESYSWNKHQQEGKAFARDIMTHVP